MFQGGLRKLTQNYLLSIWRPSVPLDEVMTDSRRNAWARACTFCIVATSPRFFLIFHSLLLDNLELTFATWSCSSCAGSNQSSLHRVGTSYCLRLRQVAAPIPITSGTWIIDKGFERLTGDSLLFVMDRFPDQMVTLVQNLQSVPALCVVSRPQCCYRCL